MYAPDIWQYMLRTSEVDMAESVTPEDVEDFLDNEAWALRSAHHTVLNSSLDQPFLDEI